MLVRACGKTEAHTKKEETCVSIGNLILHPRYRRRNKTPPELLHFLQDFMLCCLSIAWMQVRLKNNKRKHNFATSSRISCSSIFHPPINCPHNSGLSVVPSGPFLQNILTTFPGQSLHRSKHSQVPPGLKLGGRFLKRNSHHCNLTMRLPRSQIHSGPDFYFLFYFWDQSLRI